MRTASRMIAFALSALAAAAMLALCGCSGGERFEQREGFYFDTIIRIKIYGNDDAERLLDGAFELCARYDGLFDADGEDSDIGRINRAKGEKVPVAEEAAELLELGVYYSELSGGRFDISCGRVTELWDFSADEARLPDGDELLAACGTVGYSGIAIDGGAVAVPEGMKLDVGGIAKGFVADKLAAYLTENGADSAIIDLGGNIYAVGDKAGAPFSVGIQSPFKRDENHVVLSVSDCSVVTAGRYERCFEIGGVSYYHILELKSGMPARTGLSSVTVISKSSAAGDALSTICFVMGAEEGVKLIESISETEAVFITDEGEVILSSGAPKFLK